MDEFQSSFLHYVILNQEEVGNKYIKQDTELKMYYFPFQCFPYAPEREHHQLLILFPS